MAEFFNITTKQEHLTYIDILLIAMTEHYPKSLFKYFPADRVSFLDNQLLRYTPLGAFNDPFEGRPEITQAMDDNSISSIIKESLIKRINEVYNNLPPEVKQKYSHSDFLVITAKKYIEKSPEIYRNLFEYSKQMVSHIQQRFDEYIGALCLSETPNNLLMWAHYASSHSGFVVEFDSTASYFHQKKSPQDEFRHLRPVSYQKTRPSGAFTDLKGFEIFTVKSDHWSYEQEWRILRPLADADETIAQDPFPIHLFRVPRDTIKSVIIGARCSTSTEDAIRNSVKKNFNHRKVEIKKANPDESSFSLHITSANLKP